MYCCKWVTGFIQVFLQIEMWPDNLHVRVSLHGILKMLHGDSSHTEHFHGIRLIVIMLFTDHTLYSAVYNQHGTSPARGHTAVNSGSINRDASFCGLTDCVLLGMDSPNTMLGNASVRMDHLPHQVSDVITMRETCWTSDISGNENLVVTGNHASASSTVTGGTLGNGTSYLHEIFIPGGTHIFFFWLLIFTHKNSWFVIIQFQWTQIFLESVIAVLDPGVGAR